MKKRIINLLVLALVLLLSFSFVGCSNDNGNTPDAKNIDTATLADFEDVDWASICKYKVDQILDETTEDGIYSIGYTSDEKTDNIVNYFDDILKGTENYLLQDVPTIGAMLKGTINGHGITVSVQYDENSDKTLVGFFSYDESMVAD